MRDKFLAAAQKAAADTRTHGLTVEKEAIEVLKTKGVTVNDVERPNSASAPRRAPRTS